MKTYILIAIAVLLVAGGAYGVYYLTQNQSRDTSILPQEQESDVVDEGEGGLMVGDDTPQENKTETVIGNSVQGRAITAYHYGEGEQEIVFMGGIHGGYEWNTVLVAYELMDYLQANPEIVPSNVRVTVIPVLNPDGLQETVGTAGRFTASQAPSSIEATIPGRFNANNVDLNRNFECDWQSTAKWQDRNVDGGTTAFSEPESKAFRDYIQSTNPVAAVVWYSAAGGVFASNCHQGVLSETNEITSVFAQASGYPAYQEFNFYEITGDAVNWMAKERIPAISVLLSDHQNTEWTKNRKGVQALLEHYANE